MDLQSQSIPSAVMMLAATSRLLDLHQSRRSQGGGVTIPDPPEGAGRNIGIALLILAMLRDIEMERGTGAVSKAEIHLILIEKIDNITLDEIEFVIETLSWDREIHYAVPGAERKFEQRRTRQRTNLLRRSDGFDGVELTENGRMLLRVCETERSWLYDDKDAEKLITAFEHKKYKDIASFCLDIAQEFGVKMRELTDHIERPTRQEQCDILVSDGIGISEMLHNTMETIRKAVSIAYSSSTIESFAEWSEVEGPDFDLGNIQAELEVLLQMAESVSRRFMEFLQIAQERSNLSPTEHRFLGIADHLVFNGNPHSSQQLEYFLAEVLYPSANLQWFHPSILPEKINFADLMNTKTTCRQQTSFDINSDDQSVSEKRFMEFIDRNRGWLFSRLENGPLPFSELLSTNSFTLAPDESPLDFIGIYMFPSLLDTEGSDSYRVYVGLTGQEYQTQIEQVNLLASDPVIFMASKDRRSHDSR